MELRKNLIFALLLFLFMPCLAVFSLDQDLVEGDKLYEQGKFLESITVYEKALEARPGDYEALWRLSRSYDMQANREKKKSVKRKVLKKAVDYAEQAVSANKNGFEGHLYLAQSLGKSSSVVSSEEKVKNTHKIRDASKKAIELKPSHYKAYMLLGMWHRKVEAATWLEKNLAQMFFGGLPEASLEEAEKSLKKSIELKDDNLEAHYELALVFKKLKRKDEAAKELEKALRCTVRNKRQEEIKKKAAKLLKKIK
ncbi:MAG: tetratricopeptide repeat protein [Candidatus Omnitrophota bacterium]